MTKNGGSKLVTTLCPETCIVFLVILRKNNFKVLLPCII